MSDLYELQVGRWGESYQTYSTSTQEATLVKRFEDAEEGGLTWDGKSNGKHWFRILAPNGVVLHEWIPLPYVGEPYIDLKAANPLRVIAAEYGFEIGEFRDMCRRYLDATKDK